MLLVVAGSSGSSPGRAGYKMAVAADGGLCGSIGGGVMEVRLVEQAKGKTQEGKIETEITEQVHQKKVANSSGMICSGKQTVIFKQLTSAHSDTVNSVVEGLHRQEPMALEISNMKFQIVENTTDGSRRFFSKTNETDFLYQEKLGSTNELYIVGGGHCALALSELMSRMDFRISIFDDRPELNTIEKNKFADEITVLDGFEDIAGCIPNGSNIYVVIMTNGYRSDETVIRSLFDKDFRYLGILGSKAKMKTLLRTLEKEGFAKERLARIHTPIGLPINSHTPEEIAVSIAAEIISIKNS